MFFKTDVLPKTLLDHTLTETFYSGSNTVFRENSNYSFSSVVYSTIDPKGRVIYGYTIGEERKKSSESRWIRIDYDTLVVHHKFDNGYEISEEITNTSVLNNEKLKLFFGFSTHELQLLATLVQHVKIRGSNVLQD